MSVDLAELRRRIASLSGDGLRRPHPRPRRLDEDSPAERLPPGCSLEETPFGAVAVRKETAGRLEEELRPRGLVRYLGLDPTALATPVYLDTETTGLSGGTGTVPFLVGLAWIEDAQLRLAQYFLCELDQEKAMLWSIVERLISSGVLVTYNGKAFDWPLLQTRLIMAGERRPVAPPAHLDLLALARRIFRPRLPDCTLRTVEEAVLAYERADDLPGSLIPSRYFAWLRGGSSSLMEAVFAHNRQDVLSLHELLLRLDAVLVDSTGMDPVDRFSRARFLEAVGLPEEALDEYRFLWDACPWHPQRGSLGIRLARLLRKTGELKQARQVLEECWITQRHPYQAAIELAKLLEHQLRDITAAYRLVCDALTLIDSSALIDQRLRGELEHRRDRLDLRVRGKSKADLRLLPLTG